ncbi:MAG: aldose epimerase [Rhodoglobus sp.]|nr:aldose epimerase [Rhodoglobus sp.]
MTGATDVAALHRLGGDAPGDARAVVSERAASLRGLTVGGVELVQGTLEPEPPLGAGMVLVPWPNRVEGGRWPLDGRIRQLELTEPELGNANHGLLASTRYDVVATSARSLTLAAPVAHSAGYPFDLATTVAYELEATGITVRHGITNLSDRPAPVAIGAHPYLRLGSVPVGELVLTIDAGTALDLDERHIPRGSIDVTGTPFDLRSGRRVADAVEHASYGGVAAHDGTVVHRLTAPDGREVQLWAEAVFEYVQVYVTDEFPGPDGDELAIAVEPMTAPPNALQSGDGLRWLEPGETWTAAWGIRLAG